ncbi:MAG TPA: HlyD family efflux transporter periplasmic adaptor subunit [Puia sp.]|nr:HlyD family efflux transporter periplasmic adaptor subunit [Puia sp.]
MSETIQQDIPKNAGTNGQMYWSADEGRLGGNSEEVTDIMSKMPPWLVQRGIGILLGLLLLLLAGSIFIHYPDVISTDVSIYSGDIPVRCVAKSSGKIISLFKLNGDIVRKGDVICVIDNPSNYDHMLKLTILLDEMEARLAAGEDLPSVSGQGRWQLGELQPTYSDLIEVCNQYLFFRRNQFASTKIKELKEQIRYQNALKSDMRTKDSLLRVQFMLGRNKFVADSSLARDRIIAPREFDNSRSELISKELTVDATHSTVIQNDLQEVEYRKSITDLEQQRLQQDDDYRERIGQNIKKLRGEFAVWAQKYLIRSPVDGKTVFFGVWKVNQYVNAGEGILIVVPPIQDYIAKAMLPVRGAGKVKIGQRVYIKLAAYPYQEFGVIKGTVAQISSVPLDTIYSVEISLDKKLRTNIDKEIPPQAQLTGTAEVLTNNKSIFKRLFENIWVAHKK